MKISKTVKQRLVRQTAAAERDLAPTTTPTEDRVSPCLPLFRLVNRGDCESDFLAVRYLEFLKSLLPAVHLQTPKTFLLTPRDAEAPSFLEEMAGQCPRSTALQRVEEAQR